MSKQLKQDILNEYAKHHSLYKTAQKLGVQINYIKSVIDSYEFDQDEPTDEESIANHNGDPAKRRFLVGKILANSSWDNSEPNIADARRKFEDGTHNLGTGRDGPYILLYCFPQIKRTPRPNYFTPILET